MKQPFESDKFFHHKPLWMIIWDITHDCNLNCPYCIVQKEKDLRTSHGKAVQTICDLKPLILVMTGGEATILPHFVPMVKTLREKLPQLNLYLNTNGLNLKTILESSGYLDGIFFSLDGLGAVNQKLRGVSGDQIIANIDTVYHTTYGKGVPKLLKVMVVVTRTNFPHLKKLLAAVDKIGTEIEIIVKPRLPYTHPDSIASSPEGLEAYFEFWEKNRNLFNFWIYGLLSRKRFNAPATCLAQFFFGHLDYQESLNFCGLYQKQMRGDDFQMIPIPCPHPCDCKEYIDEILFSKSFEEISPNARLVVGKLSIEALQKAEKFIQTFLDKNYKMKLLTDKRLLRLKNGQDTEKEGAFLNA